jgi:hypothetical protein
MKEEPWAAGDPPGAVWRQAATGDNHVDVRMMGQRRSPGMQDAGHAHPRAHALGIGCDGHHRLGRGFEQQPVDRSLVPVGDLLYAPGSDLERPTGQRGGRYRGFPLEGLSR